MEGGGADTQSHIHRRAGFGVWALETPRGTPKAQHVYCRREEQVFWHMAYTWARRESYGRCFLHTLSASVLGLEEGLPH